MDSAAHPTGRLSPSNCTRLGGRLQPIKLVLQIVEEGIGAQGPTGDPFHQLIGIHTASERVNMLTQPSQQGRDIAALSELAPSRA